jgi:hypothetical protein
MGYCLKTGEDLRQTPGFRASNRTIIMITRTRKFPAIIGIIHSYHDKKHHAESNYLYYILHIGIWQGVVWVRRYFPREIFFQI